MQLQSFKGPQFSAWYMVHISSPHVESPESTSTGIWNVGEAFFWVKWDFWIMCALPPSTWTFNCCCTVSGMAPSTCSPVNDWASWSDLYLWLKVGCKIFFVLCESFYVYMLDHTTSTLPRHQLYQHKNIYTYLQFHPFLMFFCTWTKLAPTKRRNRGKIENFRWKNWSRQHPTWQCSKLTSSKQTTRLAPYQL